MSIFSALQAGVSGLNGQGQRLGTISDNIANATTTGYKRSDVEFSTLVINAPGSNTFSAGGVQSNIQNDIALQGTIVASTSGTDLAVAGDGFFVVAPDTVNNTGTEFTFTRAGSFGPDENGFLRNAQGFVLYGYQTDANGNLLVQSTNPPSIGTPSIDTFNDLAAINIENFNFTGSPTTEVALTGNFDADILNTGPLLTPPTSTVTYVNAVGQTETISISFNPDNGTFAGANPGQALVDVVVQGQTGESVSFDIIFDLSTGQPTSFQNLAAGAVPPPAFAFADQDGDTVNDSVVVTITDQNGVEQSIFVNFGNLDTNEGIVTSAQDFSILGDSDGAAAAPLAGIEIENDGTLFAIFENGARIPQFVIPLGTVVNPDGLTPQSGTIFDLSGDSGNFLLFTPGTGGVGEIAAGALESSNADLGEELTDLIVTQRAFSANATVIRTSDALLEELVRLR